MTKVGIGWSPLILSAALADIAHTRSYLPCDQTVGAELVGVAGLGPDIRGPDG